jgi:serine/threonine protein kinase
MFRILIIVSNALIDYNIDFGYCMNMVAVLIFFIILKCWVCYRVFVLEANWWHGVAGSGTVIPCFWCASTSHNNGFLGNLLSGQERPSNSSFSNDQSNNSGEESSTIVAPFYDIELSEQSATALSNAMDQMGRFRGVSLERTEPGELTTEKDRQAFRFPGSTGLTSSLKRVRLKKKVPLIDFSCLKIVLKRLLGVGSTARVYEGKWCGRKVAVKVLFTVEITPEEIQRTCSEASLLHSLQSPFVVRLHGIAVLPPSLCAVLEMCSEGSLGDVLYQKELKNEVSNSWSMLGRFSNSVRETVVDRRTFTGRDSLKDGNRASGVHINGSSNQYVYALPWGERLELAVGAAQGLTVLVTAFPGTSHNDIKSANYLVDCPNKDAFSTRSEIVGTYTNDALFGEPLNNDPTSKMKFVVKLADVEFASTGATPEHMIRGDTPNWTAPEVLAGTSDVSPASDIYALANVLFEIATREAPFEKTKYHNDGDTSISIKQGIIEGCRPLFPKSQAAAQSELACAQGNEAEVNRLAIELSSRASFEKLVERSWSQDPASRPEAAVLLADLKGLHVDYYERIKAWSDNRRREGALIYKASSSENGRHEDDRLKAHSRLDFGVILKKKSSSIEV